MIDIQYTIVEKIKLIILCGNDSYKRDGEKLKMAVGQCYSSVLYAKFKLICLVVYMQ